MAKASIQIEGFDAILRRLSGVEGAARKATEEALRQTADLVKHNVEQAMVKSNMPAGGKYSSGRTMEALVRNARVEWNADTASVSVGFDIKHGGLPSIFLMYGTPRMKKMQKLYNAFYSAKTRKEITELQERIFFDAIRRAEDG